ncbi:hypothetical protein EXIGLDRAFT_775528 [Exidia glandulosa HHB12029]|uniref:Uncharacterized protein n=1 Tax=Exidia glandulosa HHB12029 TaxID=1314781 RepID=A0A165DVR3_EXIGL|nr:hypothetical protein EXIGLDRAFT_775528 [Exidia glandulosa HHB12029]
MSLDDADLYGDLYGADDPDYADPAQDSATTKAEATAAPTAAQTTPVKAEPSSTPASIPPKPQTQPIPTLKSESDPSAPQPIPSYSSPVPQQQFPAANLPMRQGTAPVNAGLPPQPLQAYGAQLMAQPAVGTDPSGAGGPVRPSQMKDEG